MAIEIKLPELGENLNEGGVLELRVGPGDVVREGDILLVVEAEKSTVEVPSPGHGKIGQVLVSKGQTIQPGAVLFTLETDGAAVAAKSDAPAEPSAKAESSDQSAAAAPPAAAPVAVVEKPHEGTPLNRIAAVPRRDAATIPAGPATRRLARKLGVDLTTVPGSGPRGRVTQDDVITYSKRTAPVGGGAVAAPPLPDFAKWGPVEAKPMELIRRKTAEQMAVAWGQIAHVTQQDLSDITDLEAFRRGQDGKGPKLTVTAFALKAVAVALKEFPTFNASADIAGSRLILKKYVHVGVAVDTDRGLVVPVIRDVDRKSVRELAAEVIEIADKARQRKLPIDDLRGGTFTITNLGGIGGTGFTPIVNWPEVAILGLSRARTEPVYKDGQFVPRLMLPLSLSYDHRVIDGADGARFCRRVAAMLENPLLLLLDA